MIFCLSFLIFIGLMLLPDKNVQAASSFTGDFQSSTNDLIAEVNALRVANGLPPYTVNSILMGTAQAQADYMAAIGSVTHSGPGGITTTQRILNAGYPLAGDLSLGGFRSENITGGTNKTAAQAILEWQGDAPHLNTMLSPNLTEIGAGVAKVGNFYYMVIDCARPTTSGVSQPYTPGPDDPVVGTSAPSDFIVPIINSTPDENGLVYHEVQYGQSLWAIAIEYGVKIDEIRALNNLGSGTEIYQGDRLLIRKDSSPAPSTSTPQSTSPTVIPTQTYTPMTFPTVTATAPATESPTATGVQFKEERSSFTGIVIGIVLVALLLAGALTWMSTQKSV